MLFLLIIIALGYCIDLKKLTFKEIVQDIKGPIIFFGVLIICLWLNFLYPHVTWIKFLLLKPLVILGIELFRKKLPKDIYIETDEDRARPMVILKSVLYCILIVAVLVYLLYQVMPQN